MKEAYAVRRTVPPSAEIQASIDKLLSTGMVDEPQKIFGELAQRGARLIIQRAVEDEFDPWLGRAPYERRPERQRGLRHYEAGCATGSVLGISRRRRASCGSRSLSSATRSARSSPSCSRSGPASGCSGRTGSRRWSSEGSC